MHSATGVAPAAIESQSRIRETVDGGLTGQCRGQELDVSSLVAGNLLQVGVKSGIISSSSEVGGGEVGETLAVELILEMLKSQGIVEYISWAWLVALFV